MRSEIRKGKAEVEVLKRLKDQWRHRANVKAIINAYYYLEDYENFTIT